MTNGNPFTVERGFLPPGGGLFGAPSLGFAKQQTQEKISAAMSAFRQSVLEKSNQGLSIGQAVSQAMTENQNVLSDPDFPKSAQEFVDLLKPEGPSPVIVPAESRLATPGGKVLLGVDRKPPEPPAQVKIVDEIGKEIAKGAKADDARIKRLERLLPRDATNKINVMDALRLRVIGAEVDEDLSFPGVNKITSKEALMALRVGSDDRSATDNDLIQAAVGGDVAARQAIKVKTALKRQEMDAFMVFFASQNEQFAKFITQETPSVDEVFEKIDEARAAGPQAGAKPSKPEVPVAGSELVAPKAGGKAGQAAGPTIDKNVASTFEAIPPEQFGALDLNTLSVVLQALVSEGLTLSPEQQQALFAALQARSAEAGGGSAGAQ